MERKIGSNVFSLEPMLAMRSFSLQARLGPAFFEAVGVMVELIAGEAGDLEIEKLDEKINLAALARHAPRLGGIFAKLPPAELELITRELLGGAPGDGRSASCASVKMDGLDLFTNDGNPFDIKMRGRTIDTWLLLWFALEVHYPDFFAAVGAKLTRPAAPLSATSTGSAQLGPAGAS